MVASVQLFIVVQMPTGGPVCGFSLSNIYRMAWQTCLIGLGWVGLNWVGLGWVGLDWIGLDWVGLAWVGLGSVGLGWGRLDWVCLG